MATALDLISQALKATGVLGVGQTPLAEDTNDAFMSLRQMLAQWQKRRWLIPSLQDIAQIGNNQISNTIGVPGYFNYPRPDKIQAAYVRLYSTRSGSDFNSDFNEDFGPLNNQANGVGSDFNTDFNDDFGPLGNGNPVNQPVDYPLRQVFSYEDYAKLSLKSLNSFPYLFFYDAHYPSGNIFVWPIPSPQYEIHLIVKSNLSVPVTITDEMTIPPEYEEAIWTNLAIRLCINYQLSASKELITIAKVALNTIKNANAQIPLLATPNELKNQNFNNYNIFNDTIQ